MRRVYAVDTLITCMQSAYIYADCVPVPHEEYWAETRIMQGSLAKGWSPRVLVEEWAAPDNSASV